MVNWPRDPRLRFQYEPLNVVSNFSARTMYFTWPVKPVTSSVNVSPVTAFGVRRTQVCVLFCQR